jgi:hypothetical protein
MYSSVPNILCRVLSFIIFCSYTMFGCREGYFAPFLMHFMIHYHCVVESVLNSSTIADVL